MENAVRTYREGLRALASDPEFYTTYGWWVYENRVVSEYDSAITYTRLAPPDQHEAYARAGEDPTGKR